MTTRLARRILWLMVCAACCVPSLAEQARFKLRFFSFVRFGGDLAHQTWNPRGQGLVYKVFEVDGVIVALEESGEFRGMFDRNAVSGAIKGKLSADRKLVEEVTCDYSFRVDIREEHWAVSLRDLPLEPSPSDPSLLAAYLEGTDANCRLVPLDQYVAGVSNEHTFPDGGRVVMEELLLSRIRCKIDPVANPGGFYKMVAENQIPAIDVSFKFLETPPQRTRPSAAKRPASRIEVDESVQAAKLVTRIEPTYPELPRRAGVEGNVLITLEIDEAGNVVQAEVERGHPLLSEAALAAVRQWKYEPTLVEGTPVRVLSRATVRFTLK
jgi:TonB family protein